ncbi:MAG: V-type ATP synthase subunit F [Candidatus Omnitrophota bacterium]
MRYFCIGDADMTTGFRLAGVDGRVARTPPEVREAFYAATHMPEVGVVLICDNLAAMIRDEVVKFQGAALIPLILEVPGREGPSSERVSLAQIVRQAVGVQV